MENNEVYKKQDKKALIIVALIIILVIAGIIGGAIYLKKYNNTSNNTNEVDTKKENDIKQNDTKKEDNMSKIDSKYQARLKEEFEKYEYYQKEFNVPNDYKKEEEYTYTINGKKHMAVIYKLPKNPETEDLALFTIVFDGKKYYYKYNSMERELFSASEGINIYKDESKIIKDSNGKEYFSLKLNYTNGTEGIFVLDEDNNIVLGNSWCSYYQRRKSPGSEEYYTYQNGVKDNSLIFYIWSDNPTEEITRDGDIFNPALVVTVKISNGEVVYTDVKETQEGAWAGCTL